MKKFFKRPLFFIFLAAFFLRLFLAFSLYHIDVLNHLVWAQSILKNSPLDFYQRQFPNITDPNYPPVSLFFFVLAFGLYVVFHRIVLFLHFSFPDLFPQVFHFFEQQTTQIAFMKLPAIFADLGIALLIYQFVKKRKNDHSGIIASSIFLFNPLVFYNSAAWGQIESLVMFFIFLAFVFLLENKIIRSILVMTLAILIKQLAIIFLPVFTIIFIKKYKLKKTLSSLLIFIAIVWIFVFPFHPQNSFLWFSDFYFKSTKGVLDFATANAFNLWAILFGFDNRPDSLTFLNLPYFLWGYALFIPLMSVIALKSFKSNQWQSLFWALILIVFTAFIFLTKMHERYLFPVFIFLTILLAFNRKLIWIYLILSLVHLVNLYHFWWQPQIPFLINLLDNRWAEFFFSFINLVIFIYLFGVFAFKSSKL